MIIVKMNETHVQSVVKLLNKHLSFGLATDKIMKRRICEGLHYVALSETGEVVGYTAGHVVINYIDDFGVFGYDVQNKLNSRITNFLITHLVVSDLNRRKNIGTLLTKTIISALPKFFNNVLAVGWVKSSDNIWDAEAIFKAQGFEEIIYAKNFFYKDEHTPCPYCISGCRCIGKIVRKEVTPDIEKGSKRA